MGRHRVFEASKSKALLHTAGAGLFVLGGVSMMDERPLLGWFTTLLFGSFALISTVRLFSDAESLRLDEDGFEIAGIFKRSRFRWRDVQSIRMATIQGISVIAVDCKNGVLHRSKVSRSLALMDAKIANIYDVPPKELCAILAEWHARHGGAT